MKVSAKNIAFVAMAIVSTFASAATFGNYNACKEGNGGVGYEPTMHAKGYGPKRVVGFKLLPSEADGCHLMTTGEGRRWVFFKKGTMVYIKDGKAVMLAECQNDIFESRPIVEDEKPTTSPSQPPAQPSVVQNTTVIVVVASPPQPATAPTPAPAVAPVVESCGDGCYLGFSLEKTVPRTDKRCVIAFRNDKDEYRFVRFGVMKDDQILHGAKVDNVEAEWNHSYDLVPIGKNNNGRDQAIKMPKATCAKVLEVIQIPGILDRVGPRLGLTKTCKPVRPV